jgi:hypothetical protein
VTSGDLMIWTIYELISHFFGSSFVNKNKLFIVFERYSVIWSGSITLYFVISKSF